MLLLPGQRVHVLSDRPARFSIFIFVLLRARRRPSYIKKRRCLVRIQANGDHAQEIGATVCPSQAAQFSSTPLPPISFLLSSWRPRPCPRQGSPPSSSAHRQPACLLCFPGDLVRRRRLRMGRNAPAACIKRALLLPCQLLRTNVCVAFLFLLLLLWLSSHRSALGRTSRPHHALPLPL